MNTIGHIFRLTSFGEAHGPAMGGVVDGMPAGLPIDAAAVQRFVDRRRPAGRDTDTTRAESDRVELLSGIFDGSTLGTPIGFVVRNTDVRSADYDAMREIYRPSHADYTYHKKYGHRDHRGGGRASGRETVSRVVAGALALQALAALGVTVTAYVSAIGGVTCRCQYTELDLTAVDDHPLRCPHAATEAQMAERVRQARASGDTLGGAVTCVARGVPVGWGAPTFAKLHADLAAAMLGIGAAKAFEMGRGVEFASLPGSDVADLMDTAPDGSVVMTRNNSGGVLGGISDGADIYFTVTFKPVPTLGRGFTALTHDGRQVAVLPGGRHDVCLVPRVVPVVEAMAAITLLDHYLLNKTTALL